MKGKRSNSTQQYQVVIRQLAKGIDDALHGRGIGALVGAIERAAKEAPGVMARPDVKRTLQLVFDLGARAAQHAVIDGPPLTPEEEATLNTIIAPAISSEEFANLRSASGLTMREVAEQLQVSFSRVKAWDQGRVNIPTPAIAALQAKIAQQPQIRGRDIKRLRESLGLTQIAFARTIGIGQPVLSYWEGRDKPITQQIREKIEAAFGAKKIADLMSRISPAPAAEAVPNAS
jgi:DNA-binding transcriptional regulator YiaG